MEEEAHLFAPYAVWQENGMAGTKKLGAPDRTRAWLGSPEEVC